MPPSTPTRCCSGEDLAQIGYEGHEASQQLKRWQREGPRAPTRQLIDAIRARGIEGETVMDIGAGVGMVHVSLLEAGARHALDVDASEPYLVSARAEAARRGWAGRVDYLHGDVVALAPDLPPADVVTADMVICCYPYLPEFVDAVASVHPRLIGLVWPSDAWWVRAIMHISNVQWTLFRKPDRYYVYRREEVDGLMREAGFEEAYSGGTRLVQVVVYQRAST